ncbi:MAG: DUF3737 family protein [Sulfurospirillaceae bacterium]|nr:DUF3737 family protein [Sulfurospirillaceae bacterium]
MSETCNRRPKCTHQKYGDSTKCILHCDKSNFNDDDIRFFWEKIREEYIQYSYPDISNEIIIEDVIFPKFGIFNRYNTYFFQGNCRFLHNVKFIKCIFTDNFDLSQAESSQKITFDNCTFYGDIQFSQSNTIEIINNSQFKNEVSFGHSCWNKLEIKSTKFFQDTKIYIKNDLNIDDCTFNNDVLIDGFTTLNLGIKNGSYKKLVTISNTKSIKLEDVKLNSDVNFSGTNDNIDIKNIEFKKDVTFDAFNNLHLNNTQFHQKSNFSPNPYHDITFDNTKMNDVELHSGNTLTIVNSSEVNGNLKLNEVYQKLNIENCNIKKNLNVGNVKEIILKWSRLEKNSVFSGVYNDVDILECSFKDLTINATNTIKISDSKITGDLDLLGQDYKDISASHTEISGTIQIGKATKIELIDLKPNPSLKLINDEYEDVNIKDSRFTDVKMNSIKVLNIQKTTINGIFSLLGEQNQNLTFNTVKFKNRCDFPNITKLIFNKSSFAKDVNFNTLGRLVSNQTQFNEDVKFLAECTTIELENCEFHQKMQLSKVTNSLDFKSCCFKGEVDFRNGEFKVVNILSSTFEGDLLLSSSIIEKIHLDKITEELAENNSFSSVDFTESQIKYITIANSNFSGTLKFTKLQQTQSLLSLDNITTSTIECLMIEHSTIMNLFRSSKHLIINNFTLENVKLDTNSSEIDLTDIKISELKFNKISILKNMNFSEMKIKKFIIGNSNIEHVFRIKYSDIGTFTLISSTFEDLQIIDNKCEHFDEEKKLILRNTTIKNAVLDKLRYNSFIMNDAHVSDVKIGYVKFKKGSRETNRFFKNYYDSISDYITANTYYKQEMEEQLKASSTDNGEKFVLWIGKTVSNFGQSWSRPLCLMICFSIFFFMYMHWQIFYSYGWHYLWQSKLTIWNEFWEFLNPFVRTIDPQYKGSYSIWIFHKILMAILMYHFIVAVKRKTKR